MTTALCLSGGGAKGDFELGAITCLYERNVRPDIIASTSVGSVNAIKLAEGEDPVDPTVGLRGLELLWDGLRTNSDMYVNSVWLDDPEMNPLLRDVITGRRASLDVAPHHVDLPDDFQFFENLANTAEDVAFLLGPGQSLLKSLAILLKAQSLYDLEPIRERLVADVHLDRIATWAANGGKWRMATVCLETGTLRYVTETGLVVDTQGQPVLAPPEPSPACASQQKAVAELVQQIERLQDDRVGAAPNEKAEISAEIRELNVKLVKARGELDVCLSSVPAPGGPVPLRVPLATGVLASASIPAVFASASMGGNTYVDGGIREVIPLQVAVDLGADQVYAVSASPLTVVPKPTGTYANATLFELISRSMLELVLNEVNVDDLNPRPAAGKALPPVTLIAPDVEIHDITTIDPGLIQINKDYGWMRAADVLDGVDPSSPLWQTSTAIALTRLETWRAENRRYGHEDPTRPASGTPLPDPGAQAAIDAGKTQLGALLIDRGLLGGKTPAGVSRWTTDFERHPWSPTNNADFVSQSVPRSMTAGQIVPVTVAMRNVGVTTWTDTSGYRLGSQAPQDNLTWGLGRVGLPRTIRPGETAVFSFKVTVPDGAGATFSWRMVQDGVEWFGDFTAPVEVDILPADVCARVKAEIARLERAISDAQAEYDSLDPKWDRELREELRTQILQEQSELSDAQARRAALGCP